ncbi:hypothetical protein TRFO_29800 [Tritrichomonas foetus]|uniref:Uncharacterized protein n=1 Tax=Tritrichomonas foetus TaxID=1144522 RepID=A0A1J4JW78_9EUKA|nr:hypothetical protein TRFO_29800 [Tritrichomonas foetus]|eukprot:OHT02970.1 hypothetical protein TRFO_29800 [Tritrichomonas foetus]
MKRQTTKIQVKTTQVNENTEIQDMWKDPVFVSRQQELQKLSQDFSTAIDKLIVNKPLAVNSSLLNNSNSSSYYDSYDEEEEEEETTQEFQKIGDTVREQALLLMYEIDQMKKDTYQLISWFRPSTVKKHPKLSKMKNGLESLINYLDSLRMRAECLISYY